MLAVDRHPADDVVRITADCPLVDPVVVDSTLGVHRRWDADYTSNSLERTFPDGLDVEVVRSEALRAAAADAVAGDEREHVTPFFHRHPTRFRLASLEADEQLGHERWTLDTAEDLARLRAIVALLDDPVTAGWHDVLAVNLTGAFFGCKRAVQQMLTQEIVGEVRGRIINLSSQLGIVAAPGNCSYGVSKAGVDYLTRSVARDYAADHIVCNAIAPGKMLTGKSGHAVLPEVLAFSQSRTPWPRLGTPEDIANAALFLASDEATFIQGETLAVDGGWLAS